MKTSLALFTILLSFTSWTLLSQTPEDFECYFETNSNGNLHAPCNNTYNNFEALHINEVVPQGVSRDLKIRTNVLFVQDNNGEGNFSVNNQLHMDYWEDIFTEINYRLNNVVLEDTCICNIQPVHYNDVHIEFIPNYVELQDNILWNHRNDSQPNRLNSFNKVYLNDIHSLATQSPNYINGFDLIITTDGPMYNTYVNNNPNNLDLPGLGYSHFYSGHWYSASPTYALAHPAMWHAPDAFLWFQNGFDHYGGQWWLDNESIDFMVGGILHEYLHYFNLGHRNQNRCEHNIMQSSGSAPRTSLTGCQVREMYESLMTKNIRQYVICEDALNYEYIITGTETWSNNMRVYNNIIIEDNASLTITCELNMEPSSNIIVEAGGTLIIDNGIVTSCSDWGGIIAEGDLFNNNSARITLINDGIIENAEIGITDYVSSVNKGGMIVNSDGGRFTNNGIGVEFHRTKIQNLSTFRNTVFEGGDKGVVINKSRGIEFTEDCMFENISQVGIETEDAFITVDQCSFNGSEIAIKSSNTFPNRRGSSITGSTFEDNDIDILSTGSSFGSFNISGNMFSGVYHSVYMDGDNAFRIEFNDFVDSELSGLFMANGNSSNLFLNNQVSGSLIGTTPVYDNSGFAFLRNCFEDNSLYGVYIDGEIFNQQGDSETASSNCFESNPIDLEASNANSFIYYLPDNNTIQCFEPIGVGNYSIDFSTDFEPINCGTGNPVTPNRIYCNLGPFENSIDVLSEIRLIHTHINQVNSSSLPQSIKDILLSYYEWCLKYLWFVRGDLLVEADSIQEAINHFDTLPDFYYKIRGYGILVDLGLYNSADSLLQTYNTEDFDEINFIEIQELNLVRLQDNSNSFQPSSSDSIFIRQTGLESHPLAAYARSLWYNLTGEILYVELPEIQNFQGGIENRSIENNRAINVSINPNPAFRVLKTEIENLNLRDNKLKIEMLDLFGNVVHQCSVVKPKNYFHLNNINSGVYIVRVTNQNELIHQEKIIVLN